MSRSQSALPEHSRTVPSVETTDSAALFCRMPGHTAAAVLLRACGHAVVTAALPWLFRPKKTAQHAHVRIRKGRTISRTATRGSRPAKDKAALFRSFGTKAVTPSPCRAVLPWEIPFRPTEPASRNFWRSGSGKCAGSSVFRNPDRSAERDGMPTYLMNLSTPIFA